jgi:hypothetical protein
MTRTGPLQEHAQPVPGSVYLCQVSSTVSCGACCGLYNVADASAGSLEAALNRRTTEFARVRRFVDDIYGFQKAIASIEDQERPFRDFHHCPFIGLIGRNRSRVGCLLHPEADGNDGVDFRGLSWYGGMACRSYFCPTHRQLPDRFRMAVREAASDWYHYGLIITEVNMLSCYFSAVENRLNRRLQRGDLLVHPDRHQAVRAFFQLKTHWPFRSSDSTGPANYFFEDGQYPCPPVRYPSGCAGLSPYDRIFSALHSSFDHPEDLMAAEACIDGLLVPFSD